MGKTLSVWGEAYYQQWTASLVMINSQTRKLPVSKSCKYLFHAEIEPETHSAVANLSATAEPRLSRVCVHCYWTWDPGIDSWIVQNVVGFFYPKILSVATGDFNFCRLIGIGLPLITWDLKITGEIKLRLHKVRGIKETVLRRGGVSEIVGKYLRKKVFSYWY